MSDRVPAEPSVAETTPIFRLISRVRRLLRTNWAATGLALTVALYLGVLLALACLDLLTPLWPTMRFIALLLVVAPSAWAFVTGVLRPLFRRLSAVHVARRIETGLPGVHNRLVSCVDLSQDKRHKGYSLEFYRRLLTEALERIRGFRPASVVDFRNLRRSGAALGVVLILFVASWVLLADRLPTAMARIFNPFADIPPETGVKYVVSPGTTRLLRGDDIHFEAEVVKGDPREMRIELTPADGSAAIWHDMQTRADDRHWRLKLHGLEKSFAYRIHGGGTWSPLYEITLVDRPRIVDARAVLHHPKYLQIGGEGVFPQPTLDVSGPEDGEVEVQIDAEGDVAEGEIQLLEVAWKPVPVEDRDERVWFEDKVPEGAVSEGNWQWDAQTHERAAHTEPPANGVHSHQFHTARVGFVIEEHEYLFAWVFIEPEQKPETIMLQWHDGQNWEHRAYWGADKIGVGQPNTASRHYMGSLPEAGEWIRLEVPAKAVGLEAKAIKGMSFMLSGGQCYWHRGGAIEAPTRDERQLVVKQAFPMRAAQRKQGQAGQTQSAQWIGRFPLKGEGFYRVELRNELKYANQTMKEARYEAIHDQPPQIVLERPGSDITLSQPQKLPLAVSVYDDFAVKHVKILAQRGDAEGFRETAVKTYDEKLIRNDTALLSLDLRSFDLKPGDQVRYRAQVEDRKGQVAETRDFVVQIADNNNAADKQLARYEQRQDKLQEKLSKLIEEQTKAADKLEDLEKKYEPLEEKLAEAEAQARQEAEKAAEANPQQPAPANPPALQLDEAAAKELAELRQELAQVAGQEEQNANVGKQLANELAQAVKQAEEMKLLPPEILSEMKAAQETFTEMAAEPLTDLAQQIRKAANTDKQDPHVDQMANAAERVKQELQASAERLKALQDARKMIPENLEQALAQLRQEMLEQQAGMTARGLEDLRDMLAELREQLQGFEGEQGELLDATPVVPEVLLDELKGRQGKLDRRARPPLAEAMQLLAGDQMQRIEPQAPKSGSDEQAMPDEGGDAPDATAQTPPPKGAEPPQPMIKPALGGAPPKLDPKVAAKRPMVPPAEGDEPESPTQAERRQLAEDQFEQLMELDLAEQSLGADQDALEALMEQLREALADAQGGELGEEMKGEPADGEAAKPAPSQTAENEMSPDGEAMNPDGKPMNPDGADGQPHASQLEQVLNSPALRQALALAQRLQQAEMAQTEQQPTQAQTSMAKSLGSLRLSGTNGQLVEVDLAELDPATRAILLKMQPQLREELLQGMQEQGPEGYRKFIQDYFQRLSTEKGAK